MASHSSIVGGSTADRLLNCPGSWQATLNLPETLERTSEFAEEGTAMHVVMASLMRERWATGRFLDPRDLIGRTYHDRALTAAHVDTMIEPALIALDNLEGAYGGGFSVIDVERRVQFPNIPGAFGTCDLILGNVSNIIHVDWKFGQGVSVGAVYRDDDGEKVNAQLMFYAIGAMNSRLRRLYPHKNITLAIIQPRAEVPLSHVVVSRTELKWFREDLEAAVSTALLYRDPPRRRGEHCRWAPCRATCPLWLGPALDLSALEKPTPPVPDAPQHVQDAYGEYLAKAKELVDVALSWRTELEAQMHVHLAGGGAIPGWKLKAAKKQRQWVDPATVSTELKKLGFTSNEIWQEKLVTFESADATARRRKVTVPASLRVAPPTTETTLARADDPAPAVAPNLLREQLAASLRALQAEQSRAAISKPEQETAT